MAGDLAETRSVRTVVGALSFVVFGAVVLVMALPVGAASGTPVPGTIASLNAVFNASAALSLMAGYAFVRRGKVQAHRACMITAFVLSALFLVGYLVHHAQVGSVPFRGVGWVRTAYFAILVPHVALAAGVVPLALLSVYRGYTGRVQAHRRIARWTLPLWLYVSVSGVVVYWMLYHGGAPS
jgi:putative membrane protein